VSEAIISSVALILSCCLCAAVQTLQPYMDDGLLEYHWVDKNRMGVKGKGMPPQLQVRITSQA